MPNKRETTNYTEPDFPKFEATHAGDPPPFGGEIKVISWNIQFSQHLVAALSELREVPEMSGADIMLLQEMDEAGVEILGSELGYNYVYYPASVQRKTSRKFGNAVLSKWPISGSRKLLLPHVSPRTGEIRIATRAHITIARNDLLVYSVHTETFRLSAEKRREQFKTLVEDIAQEDHGHVIVGGDFNTVRAKEIAQLEEGFDLIGMERISAGAEPTLKAGFLGFSFDHIFTRGMTTIEKEVWQGTKASDHFPVWQRLAMD